MTPFARLGGCHTGTSDRPHIAYDTATRPQVRRRNRGPQAGVVAPLSVDGHLQRDGMNEDISPGRRSRLRRVRAEKRSAAQGRVLTRRQLYALGLTRAEVRWHIRVGRWQAFGAHCVVTHNGPFDDELRHWVAVIEGGPRAVIDGDSAMVLGGLEHYEARRIRVSVPRGARIRHRGAPIKVNVRQTRRWRPTDRDAAASGVPRTRFALATVRAAMWAASDRQATLLMLMAVQQGRTTPDRLAVELLDVRWDRRLGLMHGVLMEMVGGIRSLGELDFVEGCRSRGLPEPESQTLHQANNGTFYLDFRWPRYRVVVEVDGIQHTWISEVVADALRQNSVTLEGDTVLRLPAVGLRLCPDEFFAQVTSALAAAGCRAAQQLIA